MPMPMDISKCTILLSSIGLVSLIKFFVNLLIWFYVTFIRPGKHLTTSYGSWAVVTGATDGIGKAFALELARHGLNLVLVGRSPDKLRKVSHALQANFSDTNVITVVLDFTGDVAIGMRQLAEVIGGLDVGVLVNCAGVSYPNAMYFHEVKERMWGNVVKVNVEGTTMVTKVVVAGMVKRGRGAVVNIGSGASVVVPSFPLYAVYSATKAYVDQLSRSLYVEYKQKGIDIQCQIPLYVSTKMVPFKQHSAFTPSPEDYARVALCWIGNEPRCTPYWPHSIQWCFASLIPDFVLDLWRLQVNTSRRTEVD